MFVLTHHFAMVTQRRWTSYGRERQLSHCPAKLWPHGKHSSVQFDVQKPFHSFLCVFICRVAASQLNTLGCPELIARSRHEYEQIAIRLGNDRDYLRSMRHKVWKARVDSPLFDCKQYANGLEKLFARMWERHAHCESPDHISANDK